MAKRKYPINFAEELEESFKKLNKARREKNLGAIPVPPAWGFEKISELMYHVSLESEEGRKVKLRIAYVHHDEGLYSPALHDGMAMKFEKPIPLTDRTLTKLAPAIDVEEMMLLCTVVLEAEELVALGIVEANRKIREIRANSKIWGISPIESFIVESVRPGHLAAYHKRVKLAELSSGYLQNNENAIPERLEGFIEAAAKESGNPAAYKRYLIDLCDAIEKRRHGGTLIFGEPHQLEPQRSIFDSLKIKYPCSGGHGWKLLRKLDLITELVDGDESEYRSLVSKSLARSAKAVSKLADVDGALLLTSTLSLLGFGVEIVVDPNASTPHVYDADGEAINVESAGTRHRSAYRLVNQHPNVVAFVFSSDGGVKIVSKVRRKIVVWTPTDIELGIRGLTLGQLKEGLDLKDI